MEYGAESRRTSGDVAARSSADGGSEHDPGRGSGESGDAYFRPSDAERLFDRYNMIDERDVQAVGNKMTSYFESQKIGRGNAVLK
jgi:hypothetical protein